MVRFKGEPQQTYLILRASNKSNDGNGKAAVVDIARADKAGNVQYGNWAAKAQFVRTLSELKMKPNGEGTLIVRLELNKPDYFDLAKVYVPSSATVR